MEDKETGSYWSHVTGEAILGKSKGKKLTKIPAVQTTWADWIKEHPYSKVLKKSKQIKNSNYEKYFKDPNRLGLFRTNWLMERMPGKKLINGIVLGVHALAVPDEKFSQQNFVSSNLGDENILVIKSTDGGVRAFLAKTASLKLTLTKLADSNQFKDKETGSIWNLDEGICTKGKLKGEKLKEISVTKAFWFAWSSFYPNTKVVE